MGIAVSSDFRKQVAGYGLTTAQILYRRPDHRWLPKGITIPEVPSNVMLIAMLPICVFAQWAVYSAKRNDRPHAGLGLQGQRRGAGHPAGVQLLGLGQLGLSHGRSRRRGGGTAPPRRRGRAGFATEPS